ncbi:hypothetical protein ACIQU6_01815 [Streptomyces sp. NPDC090442]|uniref:hypothetical protein n=1 Tax=Streptomyces sp. NPDC090442 TaxID=3365962 RepID=UPI0038091FFE
MSIPKWQPWLITIIVVVILAWKPAERVIGAYLTAAGFVALLVAGLRCGSGVQRSPLPS